MINTEKFSTGEGKYKVEGVVNCCGEDLVVVIGGGTRPHVGAVAVATARPSLQKNKPQSATASVFCVEGHFEDLPAREAALKLAAKFGGTVTVTAGIHLDDAAKSDIDELIKNFRRLIEEIENFLST